MMDRSPAPLNLGFVIEQALGHVTHGKNLQAIIPRDQSVAAHWLLPDYSVSGLAGKIPGYRSNWTIRAGWRTRQMLRALARRTDIGALFFHTQVTAVLNRDWVRRYPSVVSLDATPLQYDALGQYYDHEPGAGWLEQLKWRLNRDCYQAADHLVAWTQWTKESLVADYGVAPEKVTVIPPGVAVADWLHQGSRGDGDRPVRLLFVGGDLARKGGLQLLDAFRALRARHAVELYLVTRDQVPAEPGLFVYNDMQPNSERLKQLYFTSDIFCLPTFGDCLPMVLSEAGASGLPVVSTTVAGIPEIVLEGETGFLTPAGDVPALARALESLIAAPDLRRRLGQAAIERVSAQFDAVRNAERLLALLKEVAQDHYRLPVAAAAPSGD